jgi:hypothetical protein
MSQPVKQQVLLGIFNKLVAVWCNLKWSVIWKYFVQLRGNAGQSLRFYPE